MTDMERKKERGLLTIPQTFNMALDQLEPLLTKMSDDERLQMLSVVEYMRAIVEAQAVMEQMLETSVSNFTMALGQRDMALRTLTLWQENGVEETISAASGFVSEEIFDGQADSDAVKVALLRALGFDTGSVDNSALVDFYSALDRLTAHVEKENGAGDEPAQS